MIKKFCSSLTDESPDSPLKKAFDLICIAVIGFDLILFPLETLPFFAPFHSYFLICQYIIIAVFSLEYLIRIIGAKHKWKFITSFYGIIDFLAIAPFFLSLGFANTSYVRIFRLFRLFRIFKLTRYSRSVRSLIKAISEIKVELLTIFTMAFFVIYIFSALIYFIEHQAQPDKVVDMFDAFWLAFVTITTLGYGDITPVTNAGRFLTVLFMVFSVSIVIMPASILTAHLMEKRPKGEKTEIF